MTIKLNTVGVIREQDGKTRLSAYLIKEADGTTFSVSLDAHDHDLHALKHIEERALAKLKSSME